MPPWERATALKVYDEAVQTLQDEIGIDPAPETVELARQIRQLEGDWKLEAKFGQVFQSPLKLTGQIFSLFPFVGRGMEIDQYYSTAITDSYWPGTIGLNFWRAWNR